MNVVRYRHWIADEAVVPGSGEYLPTIDPRTRTIVAEVAAGAATDVDRAVAAARSAQPGWARSSGSVRSDVLSRIAQEMASHRDELAEVEQLCTGKPTQQVRGEIDTSIAYVEYYAGVLRAVGGRVIDQGSEQHTYTRHEPFGVVGVITPWNLPLTQACRAIAPAIAVGNAVVVKPSEFTSLSTLVLARIMCDGGLPSGVMNVVTGTGPSVGEPLALHDDVRRIAFTGSPAVGRHLATIAAGRLVPMTLELGGKSPLVVFGDSDLERVVPTAVATVAHNAGQVCSATTRVLIEDAAHDSLASRIVDAVAALEPGADFGPLITQGQYDRVISHFQRAESEGHRPAIGGTAYDEGPGAAGLYVRPTVYAGVSPDASIAREEIFGPVLVTMPFADEDDAVAMANRTEFGLVASVWSGDLGRGIRVAEQIDAGQVSVNGGALGIEAPFGGFKQSGYGREKGLEAMLDYTQTKTVSASLS